MARRGDDDVRVASTIYNLAGPEDDRIDFFRSLVAGAVQKNVSVMEAFKKGIMDGPASKLSNFLHWAQQDEEFKETFGETKGSLSSLPSINAQVVKEALDAHLLLDGQVAESIERAEASNEGRLHYWVLRYCAEHAPDQPVPRPAVSSTSGGPHTYHYDESLNLVVIERPGGVVETFTPEFPSFDPTQKYLYAEFVPAVPYQELTPDEGDTEELDEMDPDPDFSSWLRMSDSGLEDLTAELEAYDEQISTFSDGRDPIVYNSDPFLFEETAVKRYDHYIQNSSPAVDESGQQYSIRTHKEFWVDYEIDTKAEVISVTHTDIGEGVTRTDTVTRYSQYLKPIRSVRESTQKIIWKTLLSPRWFIYQYGTGYPNLDAEIDEDLGADDGFFYPPLPFRINNKNVGPLNKTAIRWIIQTDALDFIWNEDKYDKFLDSDKRDVQVSLYDDERAHWVSVKWFGNPAGNWYYVESRPRDDDAELGEDDENDFDIEQDYPLYRVFSKATEENPGFYRVRVWDQDADEQWTVYDGPKPLKSKPEPTTAHIDPEMENIYKVAKRAFDRIFGSRKYDQVLDGVLENDSLSDIDYAYTLFGVSCNVKDKIGRKYIYKLLQHMLASESGSLIGSGEEDEWLAQYHLAMASINAWRDWWDSTHHSDGSPITNFYDEDGNHIDPPPEPVKLEVPPIPWKRLVVESKKGDETQFKNTIMWAFLKEEVGPGVLTKPESEGGGSAQVGDLWWVREDHAVTAAPMNNRVALYWQETKTSWRKMTATGLRYINHIYKNYDISYTAAGSINWTRKEMQEVEEGVWEEVDTGEPQESPFIFPLHSTVYNSLSMIERSQLSQSCMFLVFNCYEEVNRPWYTSTWFKVLVVVLTIGVSIAFAVATGGIGMGGAGALVGEALVYAGASTTFAIIVGTLTNIAVGVIINYLITVLTTSLFGEEAGSVVGGILGLLLGGFVSVQFDVTAFTNLFSKPEMWVALSSRLFDGVNAYMQHSAKEMHRETQEFLKKMSEESARVQELNDELLRSSGAGSGLDPSAVSELLDELLETPDMFLTRTLLTGSDIVELTLRQVESFVDDRLQLKYV